MSNNALSLCSLFLYALLNTKGLIIWSEPARLTRQPFSVRSCTKIISVNWCRARLPHLQRVRSDVAIMLTLFRKIIWKKVSPVKWDPDRCQPGSWHSGLARLLYERRDLQQFISELMRDIGKTDQPSELDFHIWNGNWPMKCEVKMATHSHGGHFCTPVSVPYAVLYASFSLPRENTDKIFLQKTEVNLMTSNIFRRNQTELQVMCFHQNKLPNCSEIWQNDFKILL